ncbi:MAG TPA: MFS transporter [Candidatus Dormibacteraeota bacterium]|nr:MFS transporter [Candidatus Dormibacteraeota bacterium]
MSVLGEVRLRLGVPDVRGRGPQIGAVVVDTLGVGLFLPVSLLYFTIATDVPVASIGSALSLGAVLALPMGLLGGTLVDRSSARAVMVLNNLLAAAGYVLYTVSGGVATIFAGALLIGTADRLFWACWPPYVTRLAGEDPFDQWFAFLEGMKAACFAVGAGAGSLLLAAGGGQAVRLLPLLNVVSCVVAAALFLSRPDGPRKTPAAARPAVRPGATGDAVSWSAVLGPGHLLLALGQVFFAPIWLLGNLALPVFYIRAWGLRPWLPSALFALSCVVVFLAQTPAVNAVRRVPRPRVIGLAAVAVSAAMALLLAVQATGTRSPAVHLGTSVGVAVLLATGYLLYMPAANALAMEATTDGTRGKVAALFDVGTAIAAALAPAAMGLLVATRAPSLWWGTVVFAGLGVTCLASARRVLSARRGSASTSTGPRPADRSR